MGYSVAIVVDSDAGKYLAELAGRLHVWARGSARNRKVAHNYWASNPGHSLEHGITTFDSDDSVSAEDALFGILPTVDEHHGEVSHDPPWDTIEVFGAAPTPTVRAALSEYGVREFVVTPSGFVCQRKVKCTRAP